MEPKAFMVSSVEQRSGVLFRFDASNDASPQKPVIQLCIAKLTRINPSVLMMHFPHLFSLLRYK